MVKRELTRAFFAAAAAAAMLPAGQTARAAGGEEVVPAMRARELAREAATARDAGDAATALARLEDAARAMPEHPRYGLLVAAALTAGERPEDAVAALGRVAALGVFFDVTAMDEFAALRGREDFSEVVAGFEGNREKTGTVEVALKLEAMTGIVEGIAWRHVADEWFFGDVRERVVWRRTREGAVVRFSTFDDRVWGVFGLEIDEARSVLWAATSAVPEMAGFSDELKGRAGVAEFDLKSGALHRVVALRHDGREHVIGDIVAASDGTIYATDSVAPVLWRLAPGADALEVFVESAQFLSLQGLALRGDERVLIVAAYGNGLIRVDLVTREVVRLTTPAGATLLGIDGLVRGSDAALLAIQNGVAPARILRLSVDETWKMIRGVEVVAAVHEAMGDPTLGCLGENGEFSFIGDAGWALFPDGEAQPAPRDVQILRVP